MATTYISDGDTVIIKGENYRVTIVAGQPELVPLIPTCVACRENDAYSDDPGGLKLCPRCVESGLTLRLVEYVMEHLSRIDPAAHNALCALREEDDNMRATLLPYVDSLSSAMDLLEGATDEDIRARVNDVIASAIIGVRDAPGLRLLHVS